MDSIPITDAPCAARADVVLNAAIPRLRVADLGSGIVAPLSFSLSAGQCLVVEGVSGAGKTRLLRLLADLDPGLGEAWLDGQPRSTMPAPRWRAQVLYQAAESAWWESTVMAHFAPQREQALALAARLALPAHRLEADLTQLSTGERQRAALLRSLLAQPSVLLLDEPSSALDEDNIARMEAVLQDCLRGGMSLVLVTHSQQQARRLGSATLRIMRRENA